MKRKKKKKPKRKRRKENHFKIISSDRRIGIRKRKKNRGFKIFITALIMTLQQHLRQQQQKEEGERFGY